MPDFVVYETRAYVVAAQDAEEAEAIYRDKGEDAARAVSAQFVVSSEPVALGAGWRLGDGWTTVRDR